MKYIGLWSSVLREIMKALSLGTFKIALKKTTIEYLGERTVFELASGSQTEWLNWSSQSLISSGQTMPYVFHTREKQAQAVPCQGMEFPIACAKWRAGWAPQCDPGGWNPPIHSLSLPLLPLSHPRSSLRSNSGAQINSFQYCSLLSEGLVTGIFFSFSKTLFCPVFFLFRGFFCIQAFAMEK